MPSRNKSHSKGSAMRLRLSVVLLAICLLSTGSQCISATLLGEQALAKSAIGTLDSATQLFKDVQETASLLPGLNRCLADFAQLPPYEGYIKDDAAYFASLAGICDSTKQCLDLWASMVDVAPQEQIDTAVGGLNKAIATYRGKELTLGKVPSDKIAAALTALTKAFTSSYQKKKFKEQAAGVQEAVRQFAIVYDYNRPLVLGRVWDYEHNAYDVSAILSERGVAAGFQEITQAIEPYGYRPLTASSDPQCANAVAFHSKRTLVSRTADIQQRADDVSNKLLRLDREISTYLGKPAQTPYLAKDDLIDPAKIVLPLRKLSLDRPDPGKLTEPILDAELKARLALLPDDIRAEVENCFSDVKVCRADKGAVPKDPISFCVLTELNPGLIARLEPAGYVTSANLAADLIVDVNDALESKSIYACLESWFPAALKTAIATYQEQDEAPSKEAMQKLELDIQSQLNSMLKAGWTYGGAKPSSCRPLTLDEVRRLVVLTTHNNLEYRIIRPSSYGKSLLYANRMLLEHAYPEAIRHAKP